MRGDQSRSTATRLSDRRRIRKTHGWGGVYETKKNVADKSKITGIIDSQNDVGGWPELKTAPAPKDTDHDGMPDKWETAKGRNPNDAADGNNMAADGYTMLEHYLNGIR